MQPHTQLLFKTACISNKMIHNDDDEQFIPKYYCKKTGGKLYFGNAFFSQHFYKHEYEE